MVSEPLFFLFPKSLSPTPASSLSPPTSCLFPGLTHNVSCLLAESSDFGAKRRVKGETKDS